MLFDLVKGFMGELKLAYEALHANIKYHANISDYVFVKRENMRTLKSNGISYYYCPELVRKDGAFLAIATDSSMIIVDDLFDLLSNTAKEFVLYHECGHIDLKHAEKQIERFGSHEAAMKHRGKLCRQNKVYEFEHEADEVAAKMIGYDKAIESLNEMHALLKSKYGVNINELLQRADYLKEASMKAE